jgi:D-glycero-D-manno-heptose 1,7-bisphosphate phosphatase
MAVDLSKQTRVPGLRPLRAVALTDSPGVLTAWANDAGFGRVFAEQVATLGSPGDVLVAISCTGNSPNVLEAAGAARGLGMHVLGLGGFDGGNLRDMSDVFIQVDSRDYGVVESVHLAIDHSLAAALSARAHARATAPSSRPVVIVDRDGVINRNVSDGVRSWDQFDFLPGSLEALADLKRRGYQVVVVTNQANIGRGLLTPAQLADIHRRMLEAVLAAGGEISGVHVCEHAPDERCVCRKPAPGLLLRAAEIHGFSLQDAFVVGDHPTDVAAARSAGAEPILVLSGRGRVDEVEQPHPLVAADLREAVEMITARSTLSARAELRGT